MSTHAKLTTASGPKYVRLDKIRVKVDSEKINSFVLLNILFGVIF